MGRIYQNWSTQKPQQRCIVTNQSNRIHCHAKLLLYILATSVLENSLKNDIKHFQYSLEQVQIQSLLLHSLLPFDIYVTVCREKF